MFTGEKFKIEIIAKPSKNVRLIFCIHSGVPWVNLEGKKEQIFKSLPTVILMSIQGWEPLRQRNKVLL